MDGDAPALAGKVALVTGGSRGMGREMAVAFVAAGAKGVCITAAAASDESRAEIEAEFAETIRRAEAVGGKGRIIAAHADVCSWADCQAAVTRTVAAFGGLDILINNAGKSPRYHGARGIPFWQTEPDGFALVIETNVVGPYNMARAAVPEMLKRGWGRIVNISKGYDAMHEAHTGAYGPSKAAVETESLSWAEELAGSGVTVNTVAPGGAVATKFGRGDANTTRGMPPTVVVPCMVWLASPASGGFTGCRFDAARWDAALPGEVAALACREAALFPRPAKDTRLDLTWQVPGRAPGEST